MMINYLFTEEVPKECEFCDYCNPLKVSWGWTGFCTKFNSSPSIAFYEGCKEGTFSSENEGITFTSLGLKRRLFKNG